MVLSLGRTLWWRLAWAFLSPGLLIAPIALLMALNGDLSALFVIVGLGWPLLLPLTLGFAYWAPVAEQLALGDGAVTVQWWSMRGRQRVVPLERLLRVKVLGRSLRLVLRGEPAFAVRLPKDSIERVQAWAEHVNRQIPSLEHRNSQSEGVLPSALDRTVTAVTHEGIRLWIAAVHTPIPLWLAALALLGAWVTLGPLLAAVAVAMSPSPPIPLLGILGVVGVALTLTAASSALAQVHALEVTLVGPRLEIVAIRSRGRERWSVPLADLHSIEEENGRLHLVVRDEPLAIPLPARSQHTVEALRAFLSEHVDASEALRGEIAPELAELLSKPRAARARERE